MWLREYKDYPKDRPLRRCSVRSGRGIIGCEMDELNGWGITSPFIPPKPANWKKENK